MLDDFNVIAKHDPRKLLDTLDSSAAISVAIDTKWPPLDALDIDRVYIVATAETSIAADLIAATMSASASCELSTRAFYQDPPRSLSPRSLVIIVDSLYRPDEDAWQECYRKYQRGEGTTIVISTQTAARPDIDHFISLPKQVWPGQAVIVAATTLIRLLTITKVLPEDATETISDVAQWLAHEQMPWHHKSPTHENYAKQLALLATGKSALFYGGPHTRYVAKAFQFAWNVTAKNLAFYGTYPEFTTNSAAGWLSHPIEKPFFIVDIISEASDGPTLEQMRITDRILSGKKPQSYQLYLEGSNFSRQYLWAITLADYISTYLAILNNTKLADNSIFAKYRVD